MLPSLPRVVSLALLALTGCATSVINGAGGTGGSNGGAGGSEGGSGGIGGEGGSATGGAGGAPACQEGETQDCYSGPEDTLGVGACVAGKQTCKDGAWDGPCVGEVLPGEETCNQIDDDCNGEADEIEETCGVGECEVTVSVCLGVACTPKAPTLEVCDGADNDCDGEVDEADPNLGAACNTGLTGTCAEGAFACLASPAGGAYLACVAAKNPTPEACNGKDDDCDGQIDEDLISVGQACMTNDFGVCAAGTTQCVGGLIDCVSNVAPSGELCNGLDDDCNGQIDEGDPETGPCQTGLMGVCGQGTLHCAAGALECTPDSLGGPETCNGADDNCDGQVDEGNPGGGVACGCGGTTVCQNGAIACQGGPVTYFFDGFANGNALGWTLGTTWQIGPALPSVGGTGNPDPANDASPSADNMLAGVVIGGNAPTGLHDFYWLESPPFDTSSAPAVVLTFKRWLNSDYTPYMQNKVQVWNGSAWVDVWASAGAPGIMENAWSTQTYTLTAYKNAQMRVRFGYNIGSAGVYTIGSWSVDDVLVASAACP